MFSLIVAALFVPVAKLLVARFAMRTVLLPAAARHKGRTAADTGSLIRTDHVFFPKQLTPNDPVQFRIDGQYAFQKVIAVDGSVVNRRIPGIDDSTVSMVNAFAVNVIAAFLVRQGSDQLYFTRV